ncbi:MAG: alanine--tRNA ligase [Desulfurococcus sp.]|nr:alanine--tRNA ligase [Desulfurococcus sp.]
MSDANLEYLRRYGFERYKCRKCEGVIWSRVPRETCPDIPCSKYEFLYKDYKRVRPLSLQEVRDKFIGFLKSRGHGVVDPYPVLARWRNDLYLTIASIVVFQPAVTDGIVDPPFNPLVIIQPSVRLSDIDNVGLTFGRHLTSFEMGGMHAFNKPGKFVYWSEGILENTVDFFTKEIGIDLDDLVFKEGWWEGGGNAGPAPEVLVDGMELATLVHMKYKVVDGKYIDNPVLVVDCGYGIERIAWFTQRTPTGFHAVYGRLVNEYKNVLGVEEPDYDLLKKTVYMLSDREVKSIQEYERLIRELGFTDNVGEFVKTVYLYSTLDHARTIGLMLSDGIVPSNTGEGYLARLVIRRMLRNLVKLGVEPSRLVDVAQELLDRQVKYWKGDYIYGKLEKHRDYITDVIAVEAGKFIDAVSRGIDVVERLLKKGKGLSADDLITIYDSYGIPPELVAEKAGEHGIKVEVPGDFYSRIAQRHSSPSTLVKEKEHELPADVVKWASSFPATRRIFHENPYQTTCEARVLGVMGRYIVLDGTVMYPWAGGQDHDTGFIEVDGRRYTVEYVGKVGDVIVHVLKEPPEITEGKVVRVLVDWYRRYRLMKHHTATHIVLAAARAVLGSHVWQAGAEKTVEKARLDITHHKSLTQEEVERIEDLANRIVEDRVNLVFHEMNRFEAEARYGLRIYQGGATYTPILRIVEIPGWDAQACFGTHVYNTAEVGGIKIINAERIQDGVIRLEFTASTRLVEQMRLQAEERRKVLSILGSSQGDLVSAAGKIARDYAESRRLLDEYRSLLAGILTSKALSSRTEICGLEAVYLKLPLVDEKLVRKLLEDLSLKHGLLTVIEAGDLIEIAVKPEKALERNLDLRRTARKLVEKGLRGGGRQDHVALKKTRELSEEEILSELKASLCTT